MINEKQSLSEFFTGTQMFCGNIRGKEEASDKMFRFKIVLSESDKRIAIPEEFIEETKEWKPACSGWRLEDILDSKGLFLDFGQKRYIKPTAKVWAEIRSALKYECQRP
ncbi:MAG: hypothetical protein CL670_03040 [Balneola sp.]|jgi:hypothetical protein|nr:hypothetical protein [Balneola sp.]MBE78108.1 hypothetical protein [Balneola sp.]HBX65152.1 hypothetical protein [Balneolaceae bacterium]|tara:strand:- start:748 stop:1074 length:327 start_codon:yes stop_codon:yes gene_type:complete